MQLFDFGIASIKSRLALLSNISYRPLFHISRLVSGLKSIRVLIHTKDLYTEPQAVTRRSSALLCNDVTAIIRVKSCSKQAKIKMTWSDRHIHRVSYIKG